jgi:hypothetical protein
MSAAGETVLSVRSSNCAAVVNICGGRRGTSTGRTCSSWVSILLRLIKFVECENL